MKKTLSRKTLAPWRAALMALAATAALSACAPALIGGAVLGGALMASDRRSPGTQVEDQGIELKAAARIRELTADRTNVNVTSYNRLVLLTGETPEAADRATVEQAVSRIEGVRAVVNEVAVMGKTSLTARSNDAILTARVKAAFIDALELSPQTVKVVTERGVVHLLGRVTEREAARAVEAARGVPGVTKVVRVFESISEAELKELQRPAAEPAAKDAAAKK
jgi:osmotically-inducible protein OsmY